MKANRPGSGGEAGAECLLFVDMLGVRSAWKRGRSGVIRRLRAFEDLVLKAVGKSASPPCRGVVETDATVLFFSRTTDALAFSVALYRSAFFTGEEAGDERIWLRGVLAPVSGRKPAFRDEVPTGVKGLTKFRYADAVFAAINAEKSGFKGMRLLISKDLVGDPLVADYTEKVGEHGMPRIATLKYSGYPEEVLPFKCSDVLWCLSADAREEARLTDRMQKRLRWSKPDAEEFLQAAATQVLFHETNAMLHTARSRAGLGRGD